MPTTNLGMDTVPTGTREPSVPVNSTFSDVDKCLAGKVTKNFPSNANLTLTDAEYLTSVLVLTDTGVILTTGRDVIFPSHFPLMYVKNSTAQTLTLKKSGQTGVALVAGADAIVVSGLTDVVRGSGGSSAVTSVNGDTGAVIVPQSIIIACSDETSDLTTGLAKVTFRMPYAFTLTEIPRASVTTAPTGSVLTVDINEGGVSILSTNLTIDATEKTSTTAATPAVLSDTSLANDAEVTIDIDGVGSTFAGAGLKVTLIGYPS